MATMGSLKQRPWLATAVAVVVVAFALLVIPFSYERVSGHQVSLALAGKNLGMDQVGLIAKEMKALLHTEHVMVRAEESGGAPSFVLTGTAPPSAGVNAVAAAHAFETELGRMGYSASASVSSVRERVNGTVYAYAYDRVIEINLDGKSASAIESEISQRLAEAGVKDAQVSVTKKEDGDQHELKVKVEAHQTSDGGTSSPAEIPQLVLKQDGAPIGGKGFTVRIEKHHSLDGATLAIHVTQDGKNATAQVAHSDTMSDAALATEIGNQLKAAGLDVIVTVSNGAVEIKPQIAQ
jgi:hypothetical protein